MILTDGMCIGERIHNNFLVIGKKNLNQKLGFQQC